MVDRLRETALGRGLHLTSSQLEALGAFVEVLVVWRKRMALVSQRTADEVIAKHVDDSLAAVAAVGAQGRTLDLGSGAGFPGLVLAIARPGLEVVLVESQRRKVSFLREVVRTTGLTNAQVVEARAEELPGLEGWTSRFDFAVSRAVWPTARFLHLSLPLLRQGGTAVAMKTSGSAPSEAAGYASIKEIPYRLGAGEDRALVVAIKA